MKMYYFQRQLQELPLVSPEIKIPMEKTIEFPDTGNIPNRIVSVPIQKTKPDKQFPWDKVVLIASVVIALVFLYEKYSEKDNQKKENN